MKKKNNYDGPQKGFEDFYQNTETVGKSKKSQGSQTFFRIKPGNSNVKVGHFRAITLNSDKMASTLGSFKEKQMELFGL